MKNLVEVRCIVCQLVFCCAGCRWKHEQRTHNLTYDCPICRGYRFLCQPEELNQDFIEHLTTEHLPLQCKKCNKFFLTMDDLVDIDKCSTISELLNNEQDTKHSINVDEKFDSIYEKSKNIYIDNSEVENVSNQIKTAMVTPIIRKKYLVDYESSDTENEENQKNILMTPHPRLTSKAILKRRAATPHASKLLKRQNGMDIAGEGDHHGCFQYDSEITPSRDKDMDILVMQDNTSTPHMHEIKLAQAVTTSTPTCAVTPHWSLFPVPGTDSPLSEIEPSESPAQSIDKDDLPSNADKDGNIMPKLKGIIINSRLRLSSQDSTEKQVMFQDSSNNESSQKIKKVKFADDTVFNQEPKFKRVFRKPKRMLTPGPQKPKYTYNPRFQALINRFENQGMTLARTPVHTKEKETDLENTPPAGDLNMPARVISFKDDSPIVEPSQSKESNELFKSCVESPAPINNAITALSANIAGTLQTCLTSVLRSNDEETEIQFQFVISKKKVSVRKNTDNPEYERLTGKESDRGNKENIWSSVSKAVKNIFWSDKATTPRSRDMEETLNSTSSSASKRKFEDMSECEFSPINHKRQKYEGRIRGRPPIRRHRGVSVLRTSLSAEQESILKEISIKDETLNLSL